MKIVVLLAMLACATTNAFGADYVCKSSSNGVEVGSMTVQPSNFNSSFIDLSRNAAYLSAKCEGTYLSGGAALSCNLFDESHANALASGIVKEGARSLVLSATSGGDELELICIRQ